MKLMIKIVFSGLLSLIFMVLLIASVKTFQRPCRNIKVNCIVVSNNTVVKCKEYPECFYKIVDNQIFPIGENIPLNITCCDEKTTIICAMSIFSTSFIISVSVLFCCIVKYNRENV